MEFWYQRWAEKWKAGGDINNPKVPLSFVRKNGELIYSNVGESLEASLPANPEMRSK
jgi:Restriction endonuclease PvuII